MGTTTIKLTLPLTICESFIKQLTTFYGIYSRQLTDPINRMAIRSLRITPINTAVYHHTP